jgi:hypothetical protein
LWFGINAIIMLHCPSKGFYIHHKVTKKQTKASRTRKPRACIEFVPNRHMILKFIWETSKDPERVYELGAWSVKTREMHFSKAKIMETDRTNPRTVAFRNTTCGIPARRQANHQSTTTQPGRCVGGTPVSHGFSVCRKFHYHVTLARAAEWHAQQMYCQGQPVLSNLWHSVNQNNNNTPQHSPIDDMYRLS